MYRKDPVDVTHIVYDNYYEVNKSWGRSVSGCGSRTTLLLSLALRDRAFYDNLNISYTVISRFSPNVVIQFTPE